MTSSLTKRENLETETHTEKTPGTKVEIRVMPLQAEEGGDGLKTTELGRCKEQILRRCPEKQPVLLTP